MMIGLLLLAQTAAVEVRTVEGGAEVLTLVSAEGPWTEARLAVRAPPDPPDRPGLGAVAAALLQDRLHAVPGAGATARVRRTPEGLIVELGAPPSTLGRTMTAALPALLAPKIEEAELARAVATAVRARRALLRDAPALAEMELRRAELGTPPPEGELSALAAITAPELSTFLRRALRRERTSVVLTGAAPTEVPKTWLEQLPTETSSSAAPPRRSRRGPGPLEVIVVDVPGRDRAHLLLGWRPPGERSEAVCSVAAAWFSRPAGPGDGLVAAWRAPLMTITNTATVGHEAAALQSMLQSVSQAGARRPSDAEWLGSVSTATRAVALALRDAPRSADSLAMDRVDPSRSLRPVLAARAAALRSAPEGLATLFRPARPVAVIVTSARADLVFDLAALRDGAKVEVVAWDQR